MDISDGNELVVKESKNQIIDGSFKIHYVAETGSTNSDLADGVKSGKFSPPALLESMHPVEPRHPIRPGSIGLGQIRLGEVLVANYQTSGRGRMDRRWEAEPGAALLASILIWPKLLQGKDNLRGEGDAQLKSEFNPDQKLLYLINMCMALALVDATKTLTGKTTQIKWPNDLVVQSLHSGSSKFGSSKSGYLKLGGILSEILGEALIIGVGVNLDTPNLDESSGHKSTNGENFKTALEPGGLNELAGFSIKRDDLLEEVLAEFKTRYLNLLGLNPSNSNLPKSENPQNTDFTKELMAEINAHSALLGKRVEVWRGNSSNSNSTNDETLSGEVRGFSPEGFLELKTAAGVQIITAGDIINISAIVR